MAQVMEPKVTDTGFGYRGMPRRIGQSPLDCIAPKDKAKLVVLPYYALSSIEDHKGPESGSMRVRRGGSWHTWSLYSRCSFRNINTEDSRYTLLGMRLLREFDSEDR